MTPAATCLDALFAGADRHWPVMGILNVTPDSFSDGGRHDATAAALARAGGSVSLLRAGR